MTPCNTFSQKLKRSRRNRKFLIGFAIVMTVVAVLVALL
jgi:hypothetical protein